LTDFIQNHFAQRNADNWAEAILSEKNAARKIARSFGRIGPILHWVWRWGDGEGGAVLGWLRDEVHRQGLLWPGEGSWHQSASKKKKVIPRDLARQVMERDAYRCVSCGTHIDLCCDHKTPESKGGETTFDNLQTMCRPCNSAKGVRDDG
jgi:hypothetical protein